jgi:glycerophosphoryl diester phosphodiesterase
VATTKRPVPSEEGYRVVIAHRGAKAYKPENTIAAFELGVAQGADMLETDLHLSRDTKIPISHDATLERFEREGELSDLTLEELREVSRRSFDARGSGEQYEPIPTLEEVLDRFGEQIPINLEIKTDASGRAYPGLQRMVFDEVVERGLLGKTLFSSFSDDALRELRGFSEEVRLAVLVDPRAPEGIFGRAAAVSAEAVNPHFVNASADLVQEAHRIGLAVYVYTVDDPEQMGELFDRGVDGIFSNAPDVLRAVADSFAA